MARQRLGGLRLIGVLAGLLLGVFMAADLSPAEARTGGFRGGFHGGFVGGSHGSFHGGAVRGFHGGFAHPFVFRNSVTVNRTFVRNVVFVNDRFFFHPFRRNVFFFNVGVGGFFPLYPAYYPYYPYPAYSPYYSPCGYYDAYGTWINAPCPPPYAPYEPPVSGAQ